MLDEKESDSKTYTLFFSTNSAILSAKEQKFSLTTNQHHQQQPNFNKANIYNSIKFDSKMLE